MATIASQPATVSMIDKVYVRDLPDADNVVVSLTLAGRQRNLNRPKDEPLEKAMTRLRAVAAPQKKEKKKTKAKQDDDAAEAPQQQAPDLVLELYSDATATAVIDAATTTNGVAWQQAKLLKVVEQLFEVHYNAPTVDRLFLHSRPMVGYRLVPVVSLLFTDEAACQWRWFRRAKGAAAGGLQTLRQTWHQWLLHAC
jgi:hypothetical protein